MCIIQDYKSRHRERGANFDCEGVLCCEIFEVKQVSSQTSKECLRHLHKDRVLRLCRQKRHNEYEDTASSVQGMGVPPIVTVQDVHMNAPPGPPLQVVPAVPNTVFSQRTQVTRSQSTSPRPRRVISPSLSIVQMHVRTVEWKANMAISIAGRIADHAIRDGQPPTMQ